MYTEHNIETTNILILVFFMAALVLQVELRTARATHYRRTLSISYSSRSQLGHSAPPPAPHKILFGCLPAFLRKMDQLQSRKSRHRSKGSHLRFGL